MPDLDQVVAEARAAVIASGFIGFSGPDERMRLAIAAMNLPSGILVIETRADEPDPALTQEDAPQSEERRTFDPTPSENAPVYAQPHERVDLMDEVQRLAKRRALRVSHFSDDSLVVTRPPYSGTLYKGTLTEVYALLKLTTIEEPPPPDPVSELEQRIAREARSLATALEREGGSWSLRADADARYTLCRDRGYGPTPFYSDSIAGCARFAALKIFNTLPAEPLSLNALTVDCD